MVSWLQLSIDTSEAEAPLYELVFQNLGALSVTMGDAGDQPLLELPPESQQLWNQTRVTALFDGDQDPKRLKQALIETLNTEQADRIVWERIEDRIWEREWLEHFKPMQFGRRLWICPEGHSVTEPDSVVIQLDPGLAFGTGTHPTTALCLEWLDGLDLVGKTVIDYGCGSGILAIAALKLGAASAIAVDHDPQALQATRDNAEKNSVSEKVTTQLPEEVADTPADILVANILAEPLVQLAPTLNALLKPGGSLALSGILVEQHSDIFARYQPFTHLSLPERCDEWILVSGTKPI
ncbi:MAG: 50S ribosomal protein L11 methyltransferase [Candidatus Thiodiazotropha sp. (ex Monitilora ramsayi)]|nr:50S ribosomal protein L11 methyltransferase [Candidatus Thiodiazotropha sp. (ex Monitilora ramsayi)]